MAKLFTDPAYPHQSSPGFTKLEAASLMIAQGLVSKYSLKSPEDQAIIAKLSVQLAIEIIYHVKNYDE